MMTRAFTLVETLIAIAVISLAIVGPFHIVQGVLRTSYIARDQLIATALAQEGVEYVRYVRDSNYVHNVHQSANVASLAGFESCYSSACTVDPTQLSAPQVCSDQSCSTKPLYLSNNLYTQQTTGTKTRFSRAVKFTQVSPVETRVTVTVTWNNHGTNTVVIEEILDNWL